MGQRVCVGAETISTASIFVTHSILAACLNAKVGDPFVVSQNVRSKLGCCTTAREHDDMVWLLMMMVMMTMMITMNPEAVVNEFWQAQDANLHCVIASPRCSQGSSADYFRWTGV